MGDNHGLKWPDGLREFDGVSDAKATRATRPCVASNSRSL